MSMQTKRKNKLRFTHVFSDSKNSPYEQVDWDSYGLSKGIALRKLINRVVKKYSEVGQEEGYFATIKDRNIFERELIWLLLNQTMVFENDVWLTVGKDGLQKVSKNAVVGVDGSGDSRFDCFASMISVLQAKSDVGVNLSKINSSKEGLPTSGPIGFMQLVNNLTKDFVNGKSFILDIDHPDILEFIKTSNELIDDKLRACVRVNDEFMKSVEEDTSFSLRSRKTGESIETVKARSLFQELISEDASNSTFSLQFDTTINNWQNTPKNGKISASSPSGEFLANDFLECPRVAIDLLKFVDEKKFDFEKYILAIEMAVTVLDISVSLGNFSTVYMDTQTKKFRPIGVSFTNLEAIFGHFKISLNSKAARVLGASIANLTSAVAYRRSAELAVAAGIGDPLKINLPDQRAIVKKHYEKSLELTDEVVDEMKFNVNINDLLFAANLEWDIALDFSKKHGFRNCQLTLLAKEDNFIFDKPEIKKTFKPIDQIKMLSRIQPFLTGGIGLPVYIDNNESVEKIEELSISAWKSGLKSITFCKK